MRIYKYTGLAFVCCLIYLFAYLAINNFQSEGASLKTCALISMPLFIWMVYQRVTAMSEKTRARESDEVICMRMMEQIHHYEEMERVAGGGRLMKGILECREVARAIRCPEFEDASLTLSRLAYIEHLLSALAPGLCRRMSEDERQRWMQMLDGPVPGEDAAGECHTETPVSQSVPGEVRG